MRHAVYLPPFGDLAEPARIVELARTAEGHGWDGVFLWDHIWRQEEAWSAVADVWVALGAVAQATTRIRIGPMVVPLARRRPQKVAREAVTLDRLSGGRLTLGIGLGVDSGGELARFGEVTDPVQRGDVLDEALEVVRSLWSGEVVHHRGEHFSVDGVAFQPGPLQEPGIPIWGAARRAGRNRPVRRAARLDGLFPVDTTLDDLDQMLDVVRHERGSLDHFDVAVIAGDEHDLDELAAHGVTWLLTRVNEGEPTDEVFTRVESGPT